LKELSSATSTVKERSYFTGYVSPVTQKIFFKDRMVLAYDSNLILNHAMSLDLARRVQDGVVINGTLQKMPANVAGRHRIPPLASLSYFDLHFGYLLPWIHAGLWVILKNFWKHLLRDFYSEKVEKNCPARNTNFLPIYAIWFFSHNFQYVLIVSILKSGLSGGSLRRTRK